MKHRILKKILSLLYFFAVFLILVQRIPAPLPSHANANESGQIVRVEAEETTTPPNAGDYACILQEGTFFYSAPDEGKGLFLLPVTYYVKLLDYGGEYCRVEYLYDDAQAKRLVGYVKTSLMTFVSYLPQRPYFYCVFDLSYKIEETLLDDDAFLNEITISCAYYGDYKIGSKTYCYVLRGDSFGYVPKPATLVVRKNTEYEEYLAQQAPPVNAEPTPDTQGSSSPAQIAILVALCLLVPVLAALILKPPRRPPYETDGE